MPKIIEAEGVQLGALPRVFVRSYNDLLKILKDTGGEIVVKVRNARPMDQTGNIMGTVDAYYYFHKDIVFLCMIPMGRGEIDAGQGSP